MKKILSLMAAIVLMAGISSCNKQKPFVINGIFILPDSLTDEQVAQISENLDGYPYYLLDVQGEIVDSAFVHDFQFSFEGTTRVPYFAYLASSFGVNMVVIEPGEISFEIGPDGETLSGTPINDGIADLEATIEEIQHDASARIEALSDEVEDAGDDGAQNSAMEIFFDAMSRINNVLDSVGKAHGEDLIGVYAVHMKTGDVTTPEELDDELEPYSDFIRNNELIAAHREYLGSQAADGEEEGAFSPEDLGLEMDDSDADSDE